MSGKMFSASRSDVSIHQSPISLLLFVKAQLLVTLCCHLKLKLSIDSRRRKSVRKLINPLPILEPFEFSRIESPKCVGLVFDGHQHVPEHAWSCIQ